jgi:hypothetical protein
VPGGASPGEERIFAAELIAALSLATDLAMGFDFEHGLRSTLVAALGGTPRRRLGDRCADLSRLPAAAGRRDGRPANGALRRINGVYEVIEEVQANW